MSNITLAPIPGAQEFQAMKEIARMAIASKLIPAAVDTPEKAMIIMLKARELRIPPLYGLSKISVINGKPAMDAELMLAVIYRDYPSAVVNYLESTDEKCVLEAKRPGGKFSKFSFTMEDAKRAGLLSKNTWKQYPKVMLQWRAVSMMARAMFPDALAGCSHTPEELGAEVNEEGEVVTIPDEPKTGAPRDVSPKLSPAEAGALADQMEGDLDSFLNAPAWSFEQPELTQPQTKSEDDISDIIEYVTHYKGNWHVIKDLAVKYPDLRKLTPKQVNMVRNSMLRDQDLARGSARARAK